MLFLHTKQRGRHIWDCLYVNFSSELMWIFIPTLTFSSVLHLPRTLVLPPHSQRTGLLLDLSMKDLCLRCRAVLAWRRLFTRAGKTYANVKSESHLHSCEPVALQSQRKPNLTLHCFTSKNCCIHLFNFVLSNNLNV